MPVRRKAPTRATAAKRPATVAEYLASATPAQRAGIAKLRKALRAAAPRAKEKISYGILELEHDGRALAGYGYWKEHVALYGFGRDVVAAHAPGLARYQQTKGTIQFRYDEPFPSRLVTKLATARVAENARRR